MTAFLNKIRTYLLSPDSPFELFLRTIYHKVLSTNLYFRWQDVLAKRSYRKFRSQRAQSADSDLKTISRQPKVTFLLSCSEDTSSDLESTLQSIKSLQGDQWEVIIKSNQDDFDTDISKVFDTRIIFAKGDYNDLFKLITGEYVIFCEAGDRFNNSLLLEFYQSFSNGSPAVLTYYDCEYFDEKIRSVYPFFKPSAYSPALLLSVNYLSRSIIYVPVLKQVMSDIDHQANMLSLEYRVTAKLYENYQSFIHIPRVLLTQKRLVTPNTPGVPKAIIDHLTQRGCRDVSFSEHKIGVRFTWQTHSPNLAIIILSKNNHRFLQTLIPDIVQQPFDGTKSIHIVDNHSDNPATIAYYQEIIEQENISIIPYPEPFNYSEAINLGVSEIKSDLVLLMNDDMALFNDVWLDELAQWAIRPEIGVVGAKLLRKNQTIQHAGIIIGLTGFAGHIYLNAPEDYHGLLGPVNWYRNYLAMTGACQMVRRDVFNEVGGYDEAYRLAFGDIDFCLKVYEKGYQNVYSPFAQIYHFEGSSRGYQTPHEDALRGYEQLEPYLINEDPFFSPNLSYSRIPKCLNKKRTLDERQQQIEARKKFYLNKKPL